MGKEKKLLKRSFFSFPNSERHRMAGNILRSLFFVFIILSIISCTKETDQKSEIKQNGPKADDQLSDKIITGSIGDASRLLPMMASDSASGTISGLVFNGLVKYDKEINLVGDLAESFEASNDCMEVKFKLRKGVKWHDGKEFTSADVMFTYEKLIDPNVATPYKSDAEMIDRVEIIDDYNLKVIYKKPFAPAIASWGMGIIPKHALEKADLNTTEQNRQPIGTGPYKMGVWDTGSKIVLKANKDYFDHPPTIDEYIFRVIPDSATMFLELKASKLDFMALSPLQFQRQTDSRFFQEKFQKFRYPAFSYTYLGFNMKNPLFTDSRIRQGLAHGINKQSIIDGVLLGLGKPATGPFPPESWAYNQHIPEFEFSPEKARALFKEAGWTEIDGVMQKNGKPFTFTILTNQGNPTRSKAAEIIQQNLKEIGITVEIRTLEWQAFLHQFVDRKNFDAIILGWALGRDPDSYDTWHSSKTKEGEFNFISYKNEEVDRLLIEGRETCDQQKRKVIYNKIHELIAADQPYVFLFYPDALPILEKRFKNVTPAPIGIWYNFNEWSIPNDKTMWYQ